MQRARVSGSVSPIIIVGSGFAGLAMAIRLKQAGIHDFILFEQAGRVGGTWRDNHYPGAACDVESHLYSFSFEPNPRWTRSFAPQAEILDYLEACARKYGLLPHIRLNTEVRRATFDERAGVWRVETSDGGTTMARVVVSACGGLNRPALPDIPGLGAFGGKTFHSARWDEHANLDGKTVAVIGTGASAIQIVPALAPKVGRLHLFQRTPPWILPKQDRAITPRERQWFARVPLLQRVARLRQYWWHELFALGFVAEPRVMKLAERLARMYLAKSVPDPVLREKLTPRYTMGCKRVLLSNDYYPALLRSNVELVTDPIEAIEAEGVRTSDGGFREVDTLILATGFQAAEAVAPFEIRGRGGRDLNDAWRDGPEAYLGTTIAGFPNLFLIVGPNVGLGHSSMVFMIESQAAYVMSCIEAMRARRWKFVDVRPEAQAEENRKLQARFPRTVWSTGCVSWYQTRSGKNTTLWPGFTFEYRLRTRRFDPAPYEVVPMA
ncbi:flavin-containing monooxygenase [Polyangium sorediatum]|uniref:NAD(P)/FAD-dependent oxidoreductase n=1 Tax=Polyangium sorediatum TaxID=889274 RepID=A0ABT6P645_9BACT|nr:NAD(P)/FAD-dependent oxidoreductase [Polyangium sorediatum]MDI1436014.1 NAD(P)/FAD-dependent oxidoreductase [Polyangium sorediatum]